MLLAVTFAVSGVLSRGGLELAPEVMAGLFEHSHIPTRKSSLTPAQLDSNASAQSDDPFAGYIVTEDSISPDAKTVLIATFQKLDVLDVTKNPGSSGEWSVLRAVAMAARDSGMRVAQLHLPFGWCGFISACQDFVDSKKVYILERGCPDTCSANVSADTVVEWGKKIVALSRSAHRVILDAYLPRSILNQAEPDPSHELLAKLRVVQFWGNTYADPTSIPKAYGKWGTGVSAKQVLVPWPYRANNSWVGITPPTPDPSLNASRPAAGYIIGKNPAQFLQKPPKSAPKSPEADHWCTASNQSEGSGQCEQNPRNIGSYPDLEMIRKQVALIKPTVQALLDAGFPMYSSCPSAVACDLPEGVQFLGRMTPAQYLQFMQKNVSFALGVGYPLLSPSPIDAMANGVAFLNPKFPEPIDAIQSLDISPDVDYVHTQHDELAASVGEPYLYSVDFQDADGVVAAARKASEISNRFASYVPLENSVERTTARVLRDVLS